MEVKQVFEGLVQRASRAICAQTNVARPDVTEVIFDQPDDLVWVAAGGGHRMVPRWMLYQDRARAALMAGRTVQMLEALGEISHQVQRSRAQNTMLAELAIDEIERLVLQLLQSVNAESRSV